MRGRPQRPGGRPGGRPGRPGAPGGAGRPAGAGRRPPSRKPVRAIVSIF